MLSLLGDEAVDLCFSEILTRPPLHLREEKYRVLLECEGALERLDRARCLRDDFLSLTDRVEQSRFYERIEVEVTLVFRVRDDRSGILRGKVLPEFLECLVVRLLGDHQILEYLLYLGILGQFGCLAVIGLAVLLDIHPHLEDFVGVVLLPYLAKSILELMRQVEHGGVIIDACGPEIEVETDKRMPNGMVVVRSCKDTDVKVLRDEIEGPSQLTGIIEKAWGAK